MDAGKGLLSRIVMADEWVNVLDRDVGVDLFPDEEHKACFMFIRKFYAQYGTIPSPQLIGEEFPNLHIGYAKEPAEYYIDKLMENYARSHGASLLMDSAKSLMVNPLKALEKIQAGISKLLIQSRPSRDMVLKENGEKRKERYLKRKEAGGVDGIETPWEVLNEATAGIHAGEFMAVVARPSVGKTFMLILLANFFAMLGLRVLFISMEMSREQITQRFDAIHYKLPYRELKAGLLPAYLEEKYLKALEDTSNEPDFIVVEDAKGLNSISGKIDQYDPDIVMIDGLYLVHDDEEGDSPWARTTNVSRGTKQLAQRKKLPVVASTQFNRVAENVGMKKVTLANLGFSDSIGQDADIVLGMFRTEDMIMNHEMFLRMLKVREGEAVDYTILWDLHAMEFGMLETDDDNQVLPSEVDEAHDVIDF